MSIDLFATVSIDVLATVSIDATVPLLYPIVASGTHMDVPETQEKNLSVF